MVLIIIGPLWKSLVLLNIHQSLMLGSCMRKLQTVFNIAVADHKALTDGIAVGVVKLVRSVQFTVLTVTEVPISHSVYQE